MIITWTDPAATPDERDALRQILAGGWRVESVAEGIEIGRRHNEGTRGREDKSSKREMRRR